MEVVSWWREKRRPLLVLAVVLWLAGYHFFHDGFYHLVAFWLVVAPLTLANPEWMREPVVGWRRMLAALLGWQLVCGLLGAPRFGMVFDAVAVVLLVMALVVVVRTPRGWDGLRWAVFGAGVLAAAWSLPSFYLLGDLGLEEERLRNVWIYPTGLNAVLTGLLTGFSMVAGLTLPRDSPGRRWAVGMGLAVLAFALAASQARSAMLASTVAVGVMAAFSRKRLGEGLASVAAGVAAYALVFFLTAGPREEPGMLERGTTGRLEIWQQYFSGLQGMEWVLGNGEVPALEEGVLGWLVHHPHASWLSQVVWCGLPGLVLLGGFVGMAGIAGWRMRKSDASPLVLLVFGVTGLVFDGAQVVSLVSVPRIEPLLVLVPAVVGLVGAAGGGRGRQGEAGGGRGRQDRFQIERLLEERLLDSEESADSLRRRCGYASKLD